MSDDVDRIVRQIRRFATLVDEPDDWKIVVPVEQYDDVKDSLETTYDVGTYYQGISLCWGGDGYDETTVKRRSSLAGYLESVDADQGDDVEYHLTDANGETIPGEVYESDAAAIDARARLMAVHVDGDEVTVEEVKP